MKRNTHPYPRKVEEKKGGWVMCLGLKCRGHKKFHSPDKIRIRICWRCKGLMRVIRDMEPAIRDSRRKGAMTD